MLRASTLWEDHFNGNQKVCLDFWMTISQVVGHEVPPKSDVLQDPVPKLKNHALSEAVAHHKEETALPLRSKAST